MALRLVAAGSRCFRRLLASVRGGWRRLRRPGTSRPAYDILLNFSAEALKDIGLSRGDLASVKTGVLFSDDTRRKR